MLETGRPMLSTMLCDLTRGNHLSHRRFDMVDQHRGVFHAQPGRPANVQLDLPAIDLREEVTAEEGINQHRGDRCTQEHRDESATTLEHGVQERLVTITNALETGLEAALEPLQKIGVRCASCSTAAVRNQYFASVGTNVRDST